MGTLLRFRRRRKVAAQRGLFDDGSGHGPAVASDASPVNPPSDAEALAGDDRGLPGDPEVARRRRQRLRRNAVVFGVVFAVGIAVAIFANRGYLDVRRSLREQDRLRGEVEAERVRVLALQRQVERLRADPREIERIAREDLGLVRPGEVVLALPPADDGTLERDLASDIVAAPIERE